MKSIARLNVMSNPLSLTTMPVTRNVLFTVTARVLDPVGEPPSSLTFTVRMLVLVPTGPWNFTVKVPEPVVGLNDTGVTTSSGLLLVIVRVYVLLAPGSVVVKV